MYNKENKPIAAQGIKSSQFSLEQNAAFFLAQEGIEAMFAIRGDAALADIGDGFEADNDSSWEWVSDEFFGAGGLCPGLSSCSFGIDFTDLEVESTITSSQCDAGNEENCRLYTDGAWPTMYRHDGAAGNESPYIRVVTITPITSASIEIVSKVTWNSRVFGGAEQDVTLRTYMFDSNYEIPDTP